MWHGVPMSITQWELKQDIRWNASSESDCYS